MKKEEILQDTRIAFKNARIRTSYTPNVLFVYVCVSCHAGHDGLWRSVSLLYTLIFLFF